jgi:hypothetical protein
MVATSETRCAKRADAVVSGRNRGGAAIRRKRDRATAPISSAKRASAPIGRRHDASAVRPGAVSRAAAQTCCGTAE